MEIRAPREPWRLSRHLGLTLFRGEAAAEPGAGKRWSPRKPQDHAVLRPELLILWRSVCQIQGLAAAFRSRRLFGPRLSVRLSAVFAALTVVRRKFVSTGPSHCRSTPELDPACERIYPALMPYRVAAGVPGAIFLPVAAGKNPETLARAIRSKSGEQTSRRRRGQGRRPAACRRSPSPWMQTFIRSCHDDQPHLQVRVGKRSRHPTGGGRSSPLSARADTDIAVADPAKASRRSGRTADSEGVNRVHRRVVPGLPFRFWRRPR